MVLGDLKVISLQLKLITSKYMEKIVQKLSLIKHVRNW